MPIQGNPLSTGQFFSQSNFNQNYALMAQQQIAAMQAAIQGNSHQINMRFTNNFPSTGFNQMRSSSFNGGKLPFNIAPFVAAAYNQIHRSNHQHSFAGSEGPHRFSPSNDIKLPGNKGLSIDELMKQVNKQIQKQEKPETDIWSSVFKVLNYILYSRFEFTYAWWLPLFTKT